MFSVLLGICTLQGIAESDGDADLFEELPNFSEVAASFYIPTSSV